MFKSTKPSGKMVFVLIMSLLLLSLSPVLAADIAVDANCTLAQAITSANTDTAADGSSCTAGSGADTITLSADVTLSEALPSITSEIKIEGGNYAISGDDAHRIFDVAAAGDLMIVNLAMTLGSANSGGAIASSGSLTIIGSAFSTNSATVDGGGIAINSGVAIITGSTFFANSASRNGGGLAVNSGVVIITSSNLSANSATVDGGGIAVNSGIVTIENSNISNNSTERDGGAIYSSGNLTLTNSTVSENGAPNGRGGGLYAATASGIASLTHLTFFGNSAAAAAGGAVQVNEATVHLRNSILYGSIASSESADGDESAAGNDCVGILTQDVSNLIGSGDCSATAITSDPKLGGLTGSPAYYPIDDDSPAFDAADSTLCTTADQIGTPRPQEAACDIGAFEYVKPIEAQAQQLQQAEQQVETTEEPGTPVPTPTLTPTPTPTLMPSTCLSLPESIVVAGFNNSTQCQRLDAGGIGVPAIIDAGFIDAVDIWSYVTPGIQVCFRQSGGSFLFLDAADIPRTASELSLSYRIEDDISEMICTQIDRAGSVILIPEP